MKHSISTVVISVIVVLGWAAVSPVAAQETSKVISIKRDSKIGGETLPKGEYSIKFADGKDGELVILRGKKEVLKATYKLTELDREAQDTSVISTMNPDGSYQLKRIEFKGKKGALVFDDTVAKAISK